MWYIYTMEYYSAIKRNKILAFLATWMDLEIIMQSEVSQTMRHQHHMLSLNMWKLKKGQNELLGRTDNGSQTLKNLWFPNETGWGVGHVLRISDRNAIKLGCDDHCAL